jgi:hypothetical protein
VATFIVPAGQTDLSIPLAGVANGDIVIFVSGSQTVNAGLNISSVNLNKLYVQGGFSGAIGSGSSAFQIGVSHGTSPELVFESSGSLFWGGGTLTATRVKHRGTGTLTCSGGTVTRLEQASGTTSIGSSCVLTTAILSGGSCTVAHNATGHTDLFVGAGTFNTQRSISGTVRVGTGASLTVQRDNATAPGTFPTAATIEMGGGTLYWRGGNITTLRAWGDATIDLSRVPEAMTITNLIITEAVKRRSILRSASAVITYTNVTVYAGDIDGV